MKERAKPREEDPFEFCEVCKHNHDQGRRHKYIPSHVRSLSSLFSRFQKKVTGIRSFVKNPSIIGTEHSNPDRIWCVFCGIDVLEIDIAFACSNAIHHLASSGHLRNLKDFLRKHGGGMDKVDSFRFTDSDLIKWENGCKSLKSAASTLSEGAIGHLSEPSKDIQHDNTSKNMDSFDNGPISSFNSNAFDAVMPLQSPTNEDYRTYPQEFLAATEAGSAPHVAGIFSCGLQGTVGHQDVRALQGVTTLTGTQPMRIGTNGKMLASISLTNGMEGQYGSGGECTTVLQNIPQISSAAKGAQANVHIGALPPWLDANEEKELNQPNSGPYRHKLTISSTQKKRSMKLNPKRVGAAWAERRRVELEMEKRGERIPNTVDANWLPNFGRVWQTGTRKESRKEFEVEKEKFLKDESQPELAFKIQPYISKRMRTCSPDGDSAVSGFPECC